MKKLSKVQKYLILSLVIIVVLLAALFSYGLFWASNPNDIPSSLIDQKAYNFEFTDLISNKKHSLQEFIGKPVIINFWGSWCFACRNEATTLETFHRSNPEIVMIGIAIRDKHDSAIDFIKEFNKTYLLGLDDENNSILLNYGVTGAPETYLIDKHGVIRQKFIGEVDKIKLGEISNYLN